jgi:transposase-like protein
MPSRKPSPSLRCHSPTADVYAPSNAPERVNKELKRRTRVATLFPSAASCERPVTAVAMEISEEWITGRIYLDMTEKA